MGSIDGVTTWVKSLNPQALCHPVNFIHLIVKTWIWLFFFSSFFLFFLPSLPSSYTCLPTYHAPAPRQAGRAPRPRRRQSRSAPRGTCLSAVALQGLHGAEAGFQCPGPGPCWGRGLLPGDSSGLGALVRWGRDGTAQDLACGRLCSRPSMRVFTRPILRLSQGVDG